METERLRIDVLRILYSIRNGERYLSYNKLKDRLTDIYDDIRLISELITLSHLRLISIQNGLTSFLEGSDLIGLISITTEGEAYFKQSLERKRLMLVANVS